jgi:uncharacterized phiE125 gp8 family phage protein
MALSRIIAPKVLPVDVEEFRQHLWNIYDNHDSDELMESLLQAATDKAEATIGRKLISQTWRTTWRDPALTIVLPFGGFQSVTAAAWHDGTTWTEVDASKIDADDTRILAEVSIDWPDNDLRQLRLDWVCGYGDRPEDVPGDIRMAIKQLAAHWYRVRSATWVESEGGTVQVTPLTFTHLLHSHRLNLLG